MIPCCVSVCLSVSVGSLMIIDVQHIAGLDIMLVRLSGTSQFFEGESEREFCSLKLY